jgi:hypothetical protein
MTVLTRDVLVEGLRRDVVFEWLSSFSVHADFLRAGFPDLEVLNENTLSLPFSGGWKSRVLTYRFLEADDKFAGRRIQIATDGKRLKGHLHFSLRTMKPSTDTLVTLHMDYDPGSMLGKVLEQDINNSLADAFVKSLAMLKQNCERELRTS